MNTRFSFAPTFFLVLLACCLLTECSLLAQQERKIDPFEADIAPLFRKHCLHCHGGTRRESGFRLDRKTGAFQGGDQGIAIVPGRPRKSPLLERIESTGEQRMPPEGKGLSEAEVARIRQWIAQGAPWPEGIEIGVRGSRDQGIAEHWAWQIGRAHV